jgi:hypothetical protein
LTKDYKLTISCLKLPMTQTECKDRSIVNFNSELISIQSYWEEIKKIRSASDKKDNNKVTELRLKINSHIEPIKNRIQKGEFTTGDKAKDFAILFYDFKPDLLTNLQKLAKDSSEHQGELFLMKNVKGEQFIFRVPLPRPKDFYWIEKFQLGIINQEAPKFDLKLGRILIANKFLSFETGNLDLESLAKSHETMRLQYNNKGCIYYHEFPYLNIPIGKVDPMAVGRQNLKLEISVGNNDVKEKLQDYKIDIEKVKYFSPILAKRLKTA